LKKGWQFTVMPSGLCNARDTFEQLMEKVLQQLLHNVCLVYLHDIIIFSKNFENMLERLRQIFLWLRSSNLKLNKKCPFLKKKIKYLGHIVSEKGVITDKEKISFVTDWPVLLKNKFEVFSGILLLL